MKIATVSLQESPLTALRDPDAAGKRLHVTKLSEALHQQGHEVTIYTRRVDPSSPERERTAHGLNVVHVPVGPARHLEHNDLIPHLGEIARFLEARWTSDRPDVIHAHHWTSGLGAVFSARYTGIPVVQSYHGIEGGDSSGIERLVGREAAHVIAVSGHEVNELVQLGVHRSGISAVPWGVDTEMFNPDGPSAARGEMPRILVVGGNASRDGIGDLISVLPAVPSAELVVVGGPDELLHALASERGVADRVTFLGRVAHARLPELMRSADLVVCSQEQSESVALEAMACGVPVVATTAADLVETVVHGVTGWHVPPREPAVLARALRSLLAHEVQRQEMSFAAWDRARVRYAWHRVALETVQAYQRATGCRLRHLSAATSFAAVTRTAGVS